MHPYGRCPLFDCKVQKAHGPENKQIIWSGPGAEAKLQYVRHFYYTTHTKQWHCGHTCAFARTDLSLYCYCRYSNYQFSHSSYFERHWLLPSPPIVYIARITHVTNKLEQAFCCCWCRCCCGCCG